MSELSSLHCKFSTVFRQLALTMEGEATTAATTPTTTTAVTSPITAVTPLRTKQLAVKKKITLRKAKK